MEFIIAAVGFIGGFVCCAIIMAREEKRWMERMRRQVYWKAKRIIRLDTGCMLWKSDVLV